LVLIVTTALTLSSKLLVAEDLEARTIAGERARMILSVPKGWPPEVRNRPRGTIFYRFAGPGTNFYFHLYMRSEQIIATNVLDNGLEGYVRSRLSSVLSNSVENEIAISRFGARMEGVCARLTDRRPKPGNTNTSLSECAVWERSFWNSPFFRTTRIAVLCRPLVR
jgi:hypothetical protein